MASTIASLLTIIRGHLVEPVAAFWSEAELVALMNLGARDLWGAINDNYKEYFVTLDVTNVSIAANGLTLTGIPADLFRIELLEARDLRLHNSLTFVPRDYRDPEFVSARALDPQDPQNGGVVYYAMMGAGAPVSAPTVYIAPRVSSVIPLTLLYVPTLAPLVLAGSNSVPGESDGALVAWTVGYARAKEREDRQPDPAWISVYATEKQNLLSRITPRQTQEADVAPAFWEGY